MKKIFSIFFIIMSWATTVFGQPNGNEWINPNQQYYKIPIAQTGIYRITRAELAAIGFPVNSADPRRFQIFHRGVEQAILVTGQNDASFDENDVIEFFGQRNDGTLDQQLYRSPDAQPHPFYNLYSDTTAYFLTVNLQAVNGKRIPTFFENNVDNLPVEPYVWTENLQVFSNNYSAGRIYPIGVATNQGSLLSDFDFGEGWTGAFFTKNQNGDFTISNIAQGVTTGNQPRLELMLSGGNSQPHRVEIFVGATLPSLRSLGTFEFQFFDNLKINENLQWSDINADGSMRLRMRVLGFDEIPADRVAIAYIKIDYARNTAFNSGAGQLWKAEAITGQKRYYESAGFTSSHSIWDISDANNIRNIGYNLSGGTARWILNQLQSTRRLWLQNDRLSVGSIIPTRFRNINPNTAGFVIISHKALRQSFGAYSDPVRAYAAYRASPAGGGYDTLTVDMDLLFDQFSYGEKTPLSIYNFTRYLIQNGAPRYLFLIGKGLTVNNRPYRAPAAVQDLVPPAGFPGSDILFSSKWTGNPHVPSIPTGRLAARTPEHVVNYLEKIVEMEAVPFDALWRKKLIHLSGGVSASELVRFERYVRDFESQAVLPLLGGTVTTVSKQTSSNVELINISDEVNEGSSLITFFGHSAPQLTDIEIGNVTNPTLGYNNRAKYPFIYVNGCDAGNIFSPVETFGENWVKAGQRGSTGFMAHAALGFELTLKRFSDLYYETAFADSLFFSKGLGSLHQETVRKFITTTLATERNIAQTQQFVMQGDPAVPLFGADKPDYAILGNQTRASSFSGERITNLTDSFQIAFTVVNYAKALPTSLEVSVIRTLPGGRTITYGPEEFPAPWYSDSLSITIRQEGDEAVGENRFEIILDPNNKLDELTKSNNSGVFNLLIPKSGTQNVLPRPYALVNRDSLPLITQSTVSLPESRRVIFQIDTVPAFNSPFLQERLEDMKRVKAILPQGLENLPDGQVLYWRTKFQTPLQGESEDWLEQSFVLNRSVPEGWTLRGYNQWSDYLSTGLEALPASKSYKFLERTNSLEIRTYGAGLDSASTAADVIINGEQFILDIPNRVCRNNSINMIAFDRASNVPYAVLDNGNFDVLDPQRCGRVPQVINNLIAGEYGNVRRRFNDYVAGVNNGDYVLFFTLGSVNYDTLRAISMAAFTELGVSLTNLSQLQTGDAYIFLGIKGATPGTAIEVLPNPASPVATNNQELSLIEEIIARFSNGIIRGPRIGPAADWQSVAIQWQPGTLEPQDNYQLRVIGTTRSGTDTLLFETNNQTELNMGGIDGTDVPFIRLELGMSDPVNFSPPILEDIQVTNGGLPEGIIIMNDEQLNENRQKSAQEGQEVTYNYQWINLSHIAFVDSLNIETTWSNTGRNRTETATAKVRPLQGYDTLQLQAMLDTRAWAGSSNLDLAFRGPLFSEYFTNNNQLNLENILQVSTDRTNPILDVAIDGRYILDGEIVSPEPVVSVRLKDENPFLKKQDTLGMEIFLRRPCPGCDFERVAFSSERILWTPASETEDFLIEYRPGRLDDGIHTLRVQGADASGNPSGSQPFVINFEVVNASTITHFYPYPNPFSSSTRFVFTLTGSEIPDEIKIQILTVSGKVVREILQDEIGPIRIGNNITQYAWDGKDEFGGQLANGVYLYRVVVRSNGQVLDQRATAADKAFKNGFGKLYILR